MSYIAALLAQAPLVRLALLALRVRLALLALMA
jgi:hypothetical protein